ncbi:SGNH/GDSL hydrolase family protein [Saccharopolyspora elongata]|uniref:SGNH/GDSL hydrolase family protein n=1 Tax=Saccharopolyspora elongata TaxID=2530387 RepID=A0A4R4YWT6_9PSEU|nr:SGNH/GDSL hydrolase family protein [Saccharopolyspora elongata]TDD48122.1 SGNH/GDSL hydrolase family protein [Saccharopolyspora elongata]
MSTSKTPRRRSRTATALAGAVLAGSSLLGAAGCASPWAAEPAAGAGGTGSEWAVAWAAAAQRPVAGDDDLGPNWSQQGFADQTLRQVVRVSTGGSQVRIRVSNVYGSSPLRVAGATVGLPGAANPSRPGLANGGNAQVWPDTMRTLNFAGAPDVAIPAGQELVSDPVPLPTEPLEKLSVTLRFAEPTGPATFHRLGLATSYRAAGDHLADSDGSAYTESTESSYYLAAVEVSDRALSERNTVVAFGDSATDGAGSTSGASSRYPDVLAERLAATHRPVAVANAGIAGNRLLSDSPCYGQAGRTRFQRDVLSRPGVRTVIIELGGNDLLGGYLDSPEQCFPPDGEVTAQRLIGGYRELVRAARDHGIKPVGATIIPLRGLQFPYDQDAAEQVRVEVNEWIRTSGEFDSVIDFDRVMADPAQPGLPRSGYVYDDSLHPNDTGYHAIANSIDLDQL